MDVVIQAMLTINRWKVPDAAATIKATMESNQARGVQVVASTVLNRAGRARRRPRRSADRRTAGADGAGRDDLQRAVLRAATAPDGFGTPKPELRHDDGAAAGRVAARERTSRLRHQSGAPRPDRTGRRTRPTRDVMMPMGANNDEWVAAVSSFVRRSFGNTGGFVTPADVARVRAATADRKAMWTLPELMALAAGGAATPTAGRRRPATTRRRQPMR